MQKILENALEIGRKYIPEGECASYIPELAKADKNHLGVCIRTRGMETFSAGDTKERFTIQSISKVITLMVALQHCGFNKVFEKMNMEPSGDAFNSLVKLDLTSDKPFNPMINAGAITTAGYLVPDVSFEDMLNYARRLCLDKDIVMDEKVFRSEMDHCARNRAIAYLLQSKGILESDVEKSLELYTRMCSLSVTAESLAGLGLVLSNGGRHPETGERLIDKYAVQVAKTIMLTCGMYDGSGDFAIRVGVPAKSGVGGGIMAVAVITMVAAAAFFAAEKGPARRRVLMAHLAFAFCFAALYAFHLILYYYNFSDVEGLALKDYDRYLSPYYQAWMLAMLCLLARSAAARWSCCVLACAAAAVVGIFCWRGIPAAGFWSDADSLYTLRADVQDRADTMNTVLDWPDRVLVLSQGDDATRWYYYRYELTAQVVNGFGGFYGRLGETQDRWDSDFMNLVESENWTLYDYKAVCVPATLVAYMQEKDCDYLLIDRADDYLQREFSPYFEGGLTADMPATLYHFEGADAAVPFTLAAVAESGVE